MGEEKQDKGFIEYGSGKEHMIILLLFLGFSSATIAACYAFLNAVSVK